MIKVGDKVSLFHDIGKNGRVLELVPKKIKTYFTGGSATNSWNIVIQWSDGTVTTEKISDVMRTD